MREVEKYWFVKGKKKSRKTKRVLVNVSFIFIPFLVTKMRKSIVR